MTPDVDHVRQRILNIFGRVDEFMMFCAEEAGNLPRSFDVGRACHARRERVQVDRVRAHERRDEAAVEST